MPVLRYFVFVGGALLVLLLACAGLMPKSSEDTVASASDVPSIRIHSDRKWPERIVFDTSATVPTSANAAQAPIPAEQPAPADAAARSRMAFAQAPADEARQIDDARHEAKHVVDARRPEAKPMGRRKVARVHVAPQPRYQQYGYPGYGYPNYGAQPSRMMVAQQPHFGFFW